MGLKQWFRPKAGGLGEQPKEQAGPSTYADLYRPNRFEELMEQAYDPEAQAEARAQEEEELRRQQWQEMPDQPIPTALWEIFQPEEGRCSEARAQGQVVCGCGCPHWRVQESNHRQRVQLICAGCGAHYLVFDAGRTGWDGLVCGQDFLERREPWQEVDCPECRGGIFWVWANLANPGRQAFLDALNSQDPAQKAERLLRERLTPQDWVDAYSWFALDLECIDGGHKQVGWLDAETADDTP